MRAKMMKPGNFGPRIVIEIGEQMERMLQNEGQAVNIKR